MKIKKVVIMSSLFLGLTSCDVSAITDNINAETFLDKLIPNWPSFVAQLVALVFVIIIVWKLAYKPVKKIIKKRQDFIESNIKESEANKIVAIENARKSEEMILESQKKANEILDTAKSNAIKEQNKIIDETNKIVAKMKEVAAQDIKLAEEEAKDSIQKQMVEVALLASEQVLSREIKDEDNKKLAEDFIKEINQ